VDRTYLLHFLLQSETRREARARMQGAAGQLRVPAGFFDELEIPLPPLDEQKEIVAAIETQFARLDDAVAALERARTRLKRYRAAVLKAACEGRLVPTEAELARQEGRPYEPATALLARIKVARTAPPKGTKSVRAHCNAPTLADQPPLPDGWAWTSMDSVLQGIEAGKSFKGEERPPRNGETGVVKVSAVTWGTYDEAQSKTCTDPRLISEKLLVQPGDFLFSRANTIELVGACVIAQQVTKRVMLSDKILRFSIDTISSHWVMYWLRSERGRQQIEGLSTGNQESMRNIGQDRIRMIQIAIPPLAEQHRIVEEVERRLSVLDRMEAEVTANLKRAESLRQSILRCAFTGRLTSADRVSDR
jgi:type I restriction enzyme S subunit